MEEIITSIVHMNISVLVDMLTILGVVNEENLPMVNAYIRRFGVQVSLNHPGGASEEKEEARSPTSKKEEDTVCRTCPALQRCERDPDWCDVRDTELRKGRGKKTDV
jgi:hypothetical protein